MKVKVIKEVFSEAETKNFKFKCVNNYTDEGILYNAVILDDEERVFVYWLSKLQGGKMLHMWYTKDAVEKYLNNGTWKVVEVLDK